MLKLFSLLLFLASCSAKHPKTDHSIAGDEAFCNSLGLSDGKDPIISETYWRCKLKLSKKRLFDYLKLKKDQDKDKNYVKNLRRDFSLAYEKLNNYRNKFIGAKHHEICYKRGWEADLQDRENLENYLKCRQNLLKIYQINPPYKNSKYLNRPQDSYQIGNVINERLDAKLAEIKEIKKNYPNCAFLEEKSAEFQQCRLDFERRKVCFEEVKLLAAKKRYDERKSCQDKIYQHFPKTMLKVNSKEKEMSNRKNRIADFYNNNSFANIGLSAAMIDSFAPKKEVLAKKDKEIAKKQEFNHEKELYSREELTRLRQKFAQRCESQIKYEIAKYLQILDEKCDFLVSIWQKPRKNEQ